MPSPPELSYEQQWLLAFALTQAVETPLYAIALRRLGRRPAWSRAQSTKNTKTAQVLWPLPLRLALGFLASLLTHPVVWFVWPSLVDPAEHYYLYCAAAESFAVLAEAALLAGFGLRYALPVSLLVNAASVCAGLLSRTLCGLP